MVEFVEFGQGTFNPIPKPFEALIQSLLITEAPGFQANQ
jgi:hypothetical protein